MRNVHVGHAKVERSPDGSELSPRKAASLCHLCFHPGCEAGLHLGISSAAEDSMTEAKFEGIGFWILLMLLLIVPWLLE